MAVLEREVKHKIVIRSLLTALLIGAFIFAAVMIHLATQLGTESGIQTASFGGVSLFELYKVPAEAGGYNAGLSFYKGIVWYCLFWLGAGIVISAFRLNRNSQKVS